MTSLKQSSKKNAGKTVISPVVKKDSRARNFATIIYPDSAPDNWREKLQDFFVPALVSPLHDRDLNPHGEQKKPHFHLLLMFEGKKSREQVQEIFNLIGGVGLEVVQSARGYARYMCHLDNPEKFQYNQEQVQAFCGADYASLIGLAIDKYKAIGEMIDFCSDNCIYSYSDLVIYARSNRYDWFRILCDSGTVVMKEFIKSFAWTEYSRSGLDVHNVERMKHTSDTTSASDSINDFDSENKPF